MCIRDRAVASVALGARILEKHFILDRGIGGPDAAFSMNKEEFSEMVRCVREVEIDVYKRQLLRLIINMKTM